MVGKRKSIKKKAVRPKKPKYKYHRPESTTPAYKAFVKAVKDRDGRTCQMPGCGYKKFVVVHHIIRWADSVGLRYAPLNGVCLCVRCHDKVTGHEMVYAPMLLAIVQSNKQKFEARKNKGKNYG